MARKIGLAHLESFDSSFPVTVGGTGFSTLTPNSILVGNSSNPLINTDNFTWVDGVITSKSSLSVGMSFSNLATSLLENQIIGNLNIAQNDSRAGGSGYACELRATSIKSPFQAAYTGSAVRVDLMVPGDGDANPSVGGLIEALSVIQGGYTGVGTTTPYSPFAVGYGSSNFINLNYYGLSAEYAEISFNGVYNTLTASYNQFDTSRASWFIKADTSSDIFRIGHQASGNSSYADNDWVFTILSDNKVGINVDTPLYDVDIAGDLNITGSFKINGVTQGIGSLWTLDGSGNAYRDSDKVFIGSSVDDGSGAVFQVTSYASVDKLLLSSEGTVGSPAIDLGSSTGFSKSSNSIRFSSAGSLAFSVDASSESKASVYSPLNTISSKCGYNAILNDSLGTPVAYGAMFAKIQDNTSGSYEGSLELMVAYGGSITNVASLRKGTSVFNSAVKVISDNGLYLQAGAGTNILNIDSVTGTAKALRFLTGGGTSWDMAFSDTSRSGAIAFNPAGGLNNSIALNSGKISILDSSGSVAVRLESNSSSSFDGGTVGILSDDFSRSLVVGPQGSTDNVPVRIYSGANSSDSRIDFKDPNTTADYKVGCGSYGDAFQIISGGTRSAVFLAGGQTILGATYELSPGKKLQVAGGGYFSANTTIAGNAYVNYYSSESWSTGTTQVNYNFGGQWNHGIRSADTGSIAVTVDGSDIAVFRSTGQVDINGSSLSSHFNYGANEDSYFRAGTILGKVYIGDSSNAGVLVNSDGLNTVHIGGNSSLTAGTSDNKLQIHTDINMATGTGIFVDGSPLSMDGLVIRTEIPSGADLNNYRTSGLYHQDANADAASGSNYPTPNAGSLEVVTNSMGNGVHTYQTYKAYDSDKIYHRTYYNGFWTAWKQIANTDGSVLNATNATNAVNATNAANAALLDNLDSSQFLRSDQSDSTSGDLTVGGNISHNGLTMTTGTDVDQIKTVAVSLQLDTDWQDTGIDGADLATGTYLVQVYADDYSVGGGHYQERYSGIMTWMGGGTNSEASDLILLHRAGHAPNSGQLYLRTLRTLATGDGVMKLQLSGDTINSNTSSYTFHFRRMI